MLIYPFFLLSILDSQYLLAIRWYHALAQSLEKTDDSPFS